MQVKLFTIPLFGSEEAVEEMNKFLRGNKVVDITKSLVQQGDVAYWSFCITWQGTIVYHQLRTDKEIDPGKVVANRTNPAEQYNELFLIDNELEELW